jgi:hydroxyacylglutathione hydrolase
MLRKLAVGAYQANCYILGCKHSLEAIVIDPGEEAFRIVQELSTNRLTVRRILLTHGHMDHTGAVDEIRRITGAPVAIHPLDAQGAGCQVDESLEDGQEFSVGTYLIRVLHTPGHSQGGVCFHAPGAVFTGDTLFAGSVGRTDFPGGDHALLVRGVKEKVFPLGDDLRIYPGHGPASTVGRERATNPFFR